ncbi:uncharacterized protein LOC113236201 [Hyposmocoma kahamanoa]|uniref:uncharacterized protein LOC113236201 n=1 Tax=Hyposmocoma kahamanoa TaxID=1477025 RepID=UPI000E6D7773|nr:uncharacterized protein LOC113236201 [Hyposmocoma kahamanoa]
MCGVKKRKFWDHRPTREGVESKRSELRNILHDEWRRRLTQPYAGLRTIEAVRPVLSEWLDRKYGVITFRMTQVLSGYGCFGIYLCRIAGREPTSACHHCDSCFEETAQHTLEECPAWVEQRGELVAAVSSELSLPTIVRSMVESKRSWHAAQAFCDEVVVKKEAAEREREDSAPDPIAVGVWVAEGELMALQLPT